MLPINGNLTWPFRECPARNKSMFLSLIFLVLSVIGYANTKINYDNSDKIQNCFDMTPPADWRERQARGLYCWQKSTVCL